MGERGFGERYTIAAPIRAGCSEPRSIRVTGTSTRSRGEFAPVSPSFLDSRSRAEAAARLARAEVAMKEMSARREQAAADLDLASSELERVRELVQQDVRSTADLEAAQRNERSAREGLHAAQFAVQVAQFEQELARASLGEPTDTEIEADAENRKHDESARTKVNRRLRLRSPIHGRVIRVFEESARALSAGSPIIEVGNTGLLELVADYLTQDAVKVRPGMVAFVEGWGGESPSGEARVLQGRVRLVEPGGFTKVSALGVEEQRVNVIVDPSGDPEEWATLGDGFRVELRILLWEQDDVVIVPTGALFRQGDSWAVFVVDEGVARIRVIELGKRSALEAEVLNGLEVGAAVILYPSEFLADGTTVEARGMTVVPVPFVRLLLSLSLSLSLSLMLSSCGLPARVAFLIEPRGRVAPIVGFEEVRAVDGYPSQAFQASFDEIGRFAAMRAEQHRREGLPGNPRINILVLSSGGVNGAFGAGILTEWTARGDRPRFDMVTGVSVGALMAPFAFAGPRSTRASRVCFARSTPKTCTARRECWLPCCGTSR